MLSYTNLCKQHSNAPGTAKARGGAEAGGGRLFGPAPVAAKRFLPPARDRWSGRAGGLPFWQAETAGKSKSLPKSALATPLFGGERQLFGLFRNGTRCAVQTITSVNISRREMGKDER